MHLGAGQKIDLPASVSDGRGIVTAFVTLILTVGSCLAWSVPAPYTMLAGLLAWIVPLAAFDLLIARTYRRASTGLDPSLWTTRTWSPQRLIIKLIGMAVTLAVLASIYAVLPAIVANLFAAFLAMALLQLPTIILIAVAYIIVVDRMMKEPEDALYQIGLLALGRWKGRDWSAMRQYALGWAIKGFFLPLMFGYLLTIVGKLLNLDVLGGPDDFVTAVVWFSSICLFIDLTVVVCGYALTLRVIDTHIRSTNPSPAGWFVCLICYAPFSYVALNVLLNYRDGINWHRWFEGHDWLMLPWGAAIVMCYIIWIWANIMFGLRFSNLTHRGIITNGPYRFTKHPSYIAKNTGWWLVSVPFLSMTGWQDAMLHSAALLGVNLVYFLRARTEEYHLMADPVYRRYASWIDRRGLFSAVKWPMPSRTSDANVANG